MMKYYLRRYKMLFKEYLGMGKKLVEDGIDK